MAESLWRCRTVCLTSPPSGGIPERCRIEPSCRRWKHAEQGIAVQDDGDGSTHAPARACARGRPAPTQAPANATTEAAAGRAPTDAQAAQVRLFCNASWGREPAAVICLTAAAAWLWLGVVFASADLSNTRASLGSAFEG